MRHAFGVLTLAVVILAGSGAPAVAQADYSTTKAKEALDTAERRLAQMKAGDVAEASAIVKLTNSAISLLNGSPKKTTPEWAAQAKRAKEIDAQARARAAEKPEATGSGSGSSPPMDPAKQLTSIQRYELKKCGDAFAVAERDLDRIDPALIDDAKAAWYAAQAATYQQALDAYGTAYAELAPEYARIAQLLELAKRKAADGAAKRAAAGMAAADLAKSQASAEALVVRLVGEANLAALALEPAITQSSHPQYALRKDRPTEAEVAAWARALRAARDAQAKGATELAAVASALEANGYGNKTVELHGRTSSLSGWARWYVTDLPRELEQATIAARRVNGAEDWHAFVERGLAQTTTMPRTDRVPDDDVERMVEACELGARFARYEAIYDREANGRDGAQADANATAIAAKIPEIRAARAALLAKIAFSDMVPAKSIKDEPELLALAKQILADPKHGLAYAERELGDGDVRTTEIVRMVVTGSRQSVTKAERRGDTAYLYDYDHFTVNCAEKGSDGNHWVRSYQFYFCRNHPDVPIGVWFVKARSYGWSQILPENIEK